MEASSRSQTPFTFLPHSYQRFLHVIERIGLPYIQEFNLWAFSIDRMQYNDDLIVRWEKNHDIKLKSTNPDIALDEIIQLWKQRSEWPPTDFGD
jgi:hypothetical protein